jgi:hypothetical protein
VQGPPDILSGAAPVVVLSKIIPHDLLKPISPMGLVGNDRLNAQRQRKRYNIEDDPYREAL